MRSRMLPPPSPELSWTRLAKAIGSRRDVVCNRCTDETRGTAGQPFAATVTARFERMDVVVDDVTQIWGEESTQVMALDHFSHHFRSGRFSCLLGPSGCGKSTLIQIVGGLEPATKGRVRIQNPEQPDCQRPLGADSVMVWQNLNLFPWRNVIDNIAFGLEMRGVSRAERYGRANGLIASVGLRGF